MLYGKKSDCISCWQIYETISCKYIVCLDNEIFVLFISTGNKIYRILYSHYLCHFSFYGEKLCEYDYFLKIIFLIPV